MALRIMKERRHFSISICCRCGRVILGPTDNLRRAGYVVDSSLPRDTKRFPKSVDERNPSLTVLWVWCDPCYKFLTKE